MRARAVLIVALLFAVSIVASVAASTPTASPEARDSCRTNWEWCELEGYQFRAVREFQPAGSGLLIGTSYMLFGIAVFDSPSQAVMALPVALSAFVDNYSTADGRPLDTSAVRPASVRALGDEVIAYAGPYDDADGERTYDLAVLGVRVGSSLYYAYGFGEWASPLRDLAGVLERVVGRDQATPTPGDDASPGSLPELADLPEGWVMTDEWVYR